MNFSIERATREDIPAIKDLLYPTYFNESTYSGLTYDDEATTKMVVGWIESLCFVAKDNRGKVIGIAQGFAFQSFYKELELAIEMFYVLPEWRGTGVARALVSNIVQQADANGVAVVYTSCASGIDSKNNALYKNLYKKFGFDELGTELIRRNGIS